MAAMPKIVEVFKHFPSSLYWVLFPIEKLTHTMKTVKRILAREKLHRQLREQSTGATSFLMMKEEDEKDTR